jgi:hypothetical protein
MAEELTAEIGRIGGVKWPKSSRVARVGGRTYRFAPPGKSAAVSSVGSHMTPFDETCASNPDKEGVVGAPGLRCPPFILQASSIAWSPAAGLAPTAGNERELTNPVWWPARSEWKGSERSVTGQPIIAG